MRLAGLLAVLALAACGPAADEKVAARDYDAFYLWAGVAPPPELARARTVYLLAGEVRRDGRYVSLRASPRVAHAGVWLVVRAQSLDWEPGLRQRILVELDRWAAAGNRLEGLQVDFDASTRGLDRYGTFLRGLRAALPPRYRLSVTGLMDWSANGDSAQLGRLRGIIDEMVVQTYRGRTTIPGYEAYLRSLSRVAVPYRIALVEGGAWREPAGLRDDPDFRGYVVFLLAKAR